MTLYWLESTLAVLPGLLWVFLGLGLPWSLIVLPREDWADRALVACLPLAFGPTLLSVWMFVLGTLGASGEQPLLTLPNILSGSAVLAVIGIVLAVRKLRTTPTPARDVRRFSPDERIILIMIAAAWVLVWLTTAYWPFIHYDPLWVYGYQGRIYMLRGYLPNEIGYYPQFLQMQYAFGQIFAGGIIDDHAARAVIPFLHLGSILAVYVLGSRLFYRRVGIFAAGLWALYPHVGEWSSVGDLEIPVTFMFTGAAAFFLMAWTSTSALRLRRRYAAVAGIFLSIAMWTKPTSGAFIFGVVLLVLAEFVLVRGQWRKWLPRFEVAAITGITCIPLGALWYIRNLLLGHPPLTFPNDFWLTQAWRSGVEFGWPLLAILLLCLFVSFAPLQKRPDLRLVWLGFAFILAGLLPTILVPRPPGVDGLERGINGLEWGLIAIGTGLLSTALLSYARLYATPHASRMSAKIGWALLLALPYFATWFYSYSYHYRLSFPVVPLLLLPVALIIAQWFPYERVVAWTKQRQTVYQLLIFALCLPGVFVTLPRYNAGWDWLWSNRYPDDLSRVATFNGSLAATVNRLQKSIQTGDEVIIAPGFQRLPFFLPEVEVRIEQTPTELETIEDADFFVFTQEAAWLYAENGLSNVNAVLASMERSNVMIPMERYWDINYFVHIYRVRSPQQRFRPSGNIEPLGQDVHFGDFARLSALDLSDTVLNGDTPVRLRWVWEAQSPAEHDYMIYVHLYDGQGNFITAWDAPPVETTLTYNADPWTTYYSTRLWQAGEYIVDRRHLTLPEDFIPDGGTTYHLMLGMYDLETNVRVPVFIDGQEAGDGFRIERTLSVK